MKLYAEISKVEAQEDGTLKVWGYASSGSVDSDGETITPDAMKAAIPDYMKFGAVREMHQPSAAGTAIEASVQEDGKTFFGAHVVDPVAVKKVQTGTYKGFSIGGKVTERDPDDKKVIKGIKLVEVSLVDRPANPEAVFTMYKAERAPEEDVNELAELLDKGEITPAAVLALIKASKKDPESNPEPEKKPDEVKKGMYSLSDFASVLSSIGWLASDANFEAQYEGDNSPIPAALRDWLKTGVGIFQSMAAEECAEMIASLNEQAGDMTIEIIEAADGKHLTLAKAGAKFSASTKAALGDIHKSMKDCCDKMAGLGYDAADDDGDGDGGKKSAEIDGLKKTAAAHDDLLKAVGAAGCPEGAVAAEYVTKLASDNAVLAKRVKELEAMPAPGKALLKAINKGDDVAAPANQVNKVAPVVDSRGDTNEIATLIKAAHQAGGHRH